MEACGLVNEAAGAGAGAGAASAGAGAGAGAASAGATAAAAGGHRLASDVGSTIQLGLGRRDDCRAVVACCTTTHRVSVRAFVRKCMPACVQCLTLNPSPCFGFGV